MSKHQKTELKTIEIQQSINEQRANDIRCKEMVKMRRRADRISLCRRMYLEAEEAEIDMNIQKAKESQARQIAELEQEQKLAQVLADMKRREIVEIKSNQLFHQNSHELRSIEQQLRTAYAKKELISQIKEREAIKKEEKVREYNNDLKIIEAGNNENEIEKKDRERRNELMLEYKNAILEQIREVTEKRRNSSPDRPMDFDFTKNGHRQGRKMINHDEFRKEMEDLVKKKIELKEKERQEADKVDKCLQNYLEKTDERRKLFEEKNIKKEAEKERVYKHLTDNIINLMSDKHEKNEMRIIVAQEEQQQAVWAAKKKEKELKIRQRDEMLMQNEMQLKIKKDKEQEEKEKDYVQSQRLLQDFQDSNKAEEMINNERRRKMIEYGKELKKSIDRRNELKNKQRALMKNESAEVAKLEEQRMTLVEKEQQITVNQHIGNLKGFYPPSMSIKRIY